MNPTSSAYPRHADWRDELREAGLRVTAPRLAVLDFLDRHPHCDAEGIHAALVESNSAVNSTITLQTVHGVVTDLTRIGLLRRIELPDARSARYETRIADNHHHIQCISCGRIEDIDCVIGHAPCITPSETHDMRLLEASITFRGVCAECESAAIPESEPTTKEKQSHVR